MRRTVVILPHALAPEGGDSVLSGFQPALGRVLEEGTVGRLLPMQESTVPEAAWVGLSPHAVNLADGPLTVAALGAEPPPRSVQFHLSLLSCDADGLASKPPFSAQPDEIRAIMSTAERLNTARMTIIAGIELDHGLVWEQGSLDLMTHGPGEVHGKATTATLPEGDGERVLRRLIEDSVDLLSSLEVNRRREQEGLPPLNLLWPWGQGLIFPQPNLTVLRGVPAWIESGSMRLEGLASLVRYRHGSRGAFSHGLKIDLKALAERALGRTISVILIEGFGAMRSADRLEHAEKLLLRIAEELVLPLASQEGVEAQIDILLPTGRTSLGDQEIEGEADGLALRWRSMAKHHNDMPFDERAVGEARLRRNSVWETMEEALCGSSG